MSIQYCPECGRSVDTDLEEFDDDMCLRCIEIRGELKNENKKV